MSTQLTDYSEDELYHSIGRTLLLSLPDGWQTVAMTFEMIDADVWETSAVVDTGDGRDTYISLRPSGFELDDYFVELARRMAEAGHGQWDKAVFNMTAAGKFNIDFTYPE